MLWQIILIPIFFNLRHPPNFWNILPGDTTEQPVKIFSQLSKSTHKPQSNQETLLCSVTPNFLCAEAFSKRVRLSLFYMLYNSKHV